MLKTENLNQNSKREFEERPFHRFHDHKLPHHKMKYASLGIACVLAFGVALAGFFASQKKKNR